MAPSVAQPGDVVQWAVGCAREEYDAEVSLRLEEGFQAFLRGSQEARVRCFMEDDQRIVDFRMMEERSDMSSGGTVVRPVFRGLRGLASIGAARECSAAVRVEWGHGQDVVAGVGLVPFGESTAAILEESFAKFKAGVGLKGIVFTASNGADYMVDFDSMEQLRVATRRARPIYRHVVGQDWRGGATPASTHPASSGRKAICSGSRTLLLQQQKLQHAMPQVPREAVQLDVRKEPSCWNVAQLLSHAITAIQYGRRQRS